MLEVLMCRMRVSITSQSICIITSNSWSLMTLSVERERDRERVRYTMRETPANENLSGYRCQTNVINVMNGQQDVFDLLFARPAFNIHFFRTIKKHKQIYTTPATHSTSSLYNTTAVPLVTKHRIISQMTNYKNQHLEIYI